MKMYRAMGANLYPDLADSPRASMYGTALYPCGFGIPTLFHSSSMACAALWCQILASVFPSCILSCEGARSPGPCSYLTVIAAPAVRWGQAREAVRSAAAYREGSRPDLHPALEPSPARSAAQVCSG